MNDDYKQSAERFARDTTGMEMTVLHEEGLYRHLRFMPRQRGFYWFDLITTPYGLVFSGDGESYVFSIDATKDMFVLFKKSSYRGSINPGYWSEKLRSNRDAVMTYSEDLFEAQVAEDLKDAEGYFPGVTAAWKRHVESEFNTEYENEARRALDTFEYLANGSNGQAFSFSDTWEWDLQGYDWWFLWACRAIIAGIERYDRVRYYGLGALAAPKRERTVEDVTAKQVAA